MKMALGKSLKMYLTTLFVATTCIYMVLYQYHISPQPMPTEILKKKDLSVDAMELSMGTEKHESRISTSKATDFVRRYNLFLWSPMSIFTSTNQQQEQSQNKLKQKQQQIANNFNTSKNITAADIASSLTATSTSSSSLLPALVTSSTSFKYKRQKDLEIPTPLQSSLENHSLSSYDARPHHNHSHHQYAKKIKKENNNIGHLIVDDAVAIVANHTISTTITTTTTTRTSTVGSTSSIPVTFTNISSSDSLAYPTKIIQSKSSTTTKTTTLTSNSKSSLRKFVADVTPPPLYIITPTYPRPEQLAELTRLGYTLKHISNLLWLVIEDANKTSPLVTQTLNRIGVPYEYLLAPMPELYRKTRKVKPRGVSNRNRGLQWLRENATEGVFYFADDDNTYDVTIFEQMRYTKKVSMWPVGLIPKFGVSSPIIRKGKIDGYYDGWLGGRKYAVDMAGFAVSVKFLHERPAAKMPFKPGYEEDGFLKSLAPLNMTEIELLASECTEILTWHTQTKKNAPGERLNVTKYGDTNLVSLDKGLVRP